MLAGFSWWKFLQLKVNFDLWLYLEWSLGGSIAITRPLFSLVSPLGALSVLGCNCRFWCTLQMNSIEWLRIDDPVGSICSRCMRYLG